MLQFVLILWGLGTLAAGLVLGASLYVASRAEEGDNPEYRLEGGQIESKLRRGVTGHARP